MAADRRVSLIGVVDALTDGERARHPGSLAIAAYFDGWNQAAGGGARVFPRYLTRDEEEAWRDGWAEGKAELVTVVRLGDRLRPLLGLSA